MWWINIYKNYIDILLHWHWLHIFFLSKICILLYNFSLELLHTILRPSGSTTSFSISRMITIVCNVTLTTSLIPSPEINVKINFHHLKSYNKQKNVIIKYSIPFKVLKFKNHWNDEFVSEFIFILIFTCHWDNSNSQVDQN